MSTNFTFNSKCPAFPKFGSPIFRKFAEIPSIRRSFSGGAVTASLGISAPTHVAQLKLDADSSFTLIPALSTGVTHSSSQTSLNVGVSTSHLIVTKAIDWDEPSINPDESPFSHAHQGFEVGGELDVADVGKVSVRSGAGGVEMLVTPPDLTWKNHQFETGIQLLMFTPHSGTTWRSALGVSTRVPLTRLGLPTVPGVSKNPDFTVKIDSNMDVEAQIEIPIKENLTEYFSADLCVGVGVGRTLAGPVSNSRFRVFAQCGVASVSVGTDGVALFGLTVFGGDHSTA